MARWRRGDTEAFNAVMSAGDKARAMYEKYQAGQAFKDASQVTEAGQVQSAASRAEADALSAQDAQTFGIPPEEQASGQYAQRAAIADASNKQYGLGKNPTSFRSTAYTPEEQAAAGYRGQQTYYAASGDTEKALDLGLKSKAIEAAALQQELTKGQLARQPLELENTQIGLQNNREEAKTRKARQDVMTKIAGVEARLADPKTRFEALTEISNYHSGDDEFGGKSKSTIIKNPITGEPQIAYFPADSESASSIRAYTPELGRKALDAYASQLLSKTSPEAFAADLAYRDTREDKIFDRGLRKDELAIRQKTLDAQIEHFGAQARNWAAQRADAKRTYELNMSRHGPDSPEAKTAKLAYTKEERWDSGLQKLSTMIEDGEDPMKVNAYATKLAREGGPDKMVKGERFDPVTGMKETMLMSPLASRVQEYGAQYAAKKQAEVTSKYNPRDKVEVLVSKTGETGYVSARTPKGTVYRSEEEMVTADKIKPAKSVGLSKTAPSANFNTGEAIPGSQAAGIVESRRAAQETAAAAAVAAQEERQRQQAEETVRLEAEAVKYRQRNGLPLGG